MGMYRKKPVIIEAIQYTGDNMAEIEMFVPTGKYGKGCFYISTLEGEMKASPGDFIIKGISGEFYPCKPDIFEMTYEKVDP